MGDRTKAFDSKRRSALSALAGAGAFGAAIARPSRGHASEEWPTKPIKFVSPLAAGGSTDRLGRVIANGLGELWKQPAIVENKPGASGMIAAEHVARAPADGYTALFAQVALIQAPSLFDSVPYDPLRDFAAVSLLGTVPVVLAVRADSPYRTLEDYLAAARKPNSQIRFGSFGIGSSFHIYGETLMRDAKVPLIHVPYKGEAPAIADVLGGHLESTFSSVSSARPLIQDKRLRALAVVGRRVASLPDVPGFPELGFQRLDVRGWFGVVVPTGVPRRIIDKMADGVRLMAGRGEIVDTFRGMGGDLIASSPDEFTAFLRSDFEKWSRMIREAGIKANR